MYKIMILLNTFPSEISWPIFTKFHIDPIVETGSRVCSNGHAPLTVMSIYGKIMMIIIIITFFFFKTKNCSNGILQWLLTQVSETWPMRLLSFFLFYYYYYFYFIFIIFIF